MCDYFDSDEWRAKKRRGAREWSLSHCLEFVECVDDSEATLSTLADRHPDDADVEGLRHTTVAEAFELFGESTLGFDFATVQQTYDAKSQLPRECRREPVAEGRCLFHLPPADRPPEANASDAFRRRVSEVAELGDEVERSDLQFVGATFENLDISNFEMPDALPFEIDLRFATVRGNFEGREARVTGIVSMRYARIGGKTSFRDAVFEGPLRCYGARFEGDVDGKGVTFHHNAKFERTTFGGSVRFRRATFHRRAPFHRARFEGAAVFDHTRFLGKTDVVEATFTRTPNFGDVRFEDAVRFECVAPAVSCTDAYVGGGTVTVSETFETVYDFAGATMENVDLIGQDGKNAVEYVDFFDTTFGAFDFLSHHDAFAWTDWSLHDRSASAGEMDPARLMKTYVKARVGADSAGDSKAAAEFFRWEKRFRRRLHAERLWEEGHSPMKRLRFLRQWFSNLVLHVVTGYGERPWQVVASAATLVGLFTAVFVVLRGTYTWSGVASAAILSVGSFVTLVFGDTAAVNDGAVQFVAQIEGFLGAFFIALFVYTLTRSLHR